MEVERLMEIESKRRMGKEGEKGGSERERERERCQSRIEQ